MHRHVHIHIIASAGGLAYRPTLESKDYQPARSTTTEAAEYRWIEIPKDAPQMQEKFLADQFKKKFLRRLKHLYKGGQLIIPDCEELSGVDSLEGFTQWLEPQESRNWKVDVEITPDHLLNSHHLQQYVANYVAGTAISDYRIVSVDDKMVTITKWCYRTEQQMTEKMPGEEFVSRFLMHIVPSGCQRLRGHGLFRGQMRKSHLDRCHRLIRSVGEGKEPIETGTTAPRAVGSSDTNDGKQEQEAPYRERDIRPPCCRQCGCSAMQRVEHRDARQTRQWLERIRHVIYLYERRWTLDGIIAAKEREQRRPPSQQLDFDDWHCARMWSMVFTSCLIQSVSNLTLNRSLNDSLTIDDRDAVIVDDDLVIDDWSISIALTTFTLPLPNW